LTPSARSGNLIAGDGMKNGLSRSEQKTVSTTQNNRLTGKAPYKSTANLTAEDVTGQHDRRSVPHRLEANCESRPCLVIAGVYPRKDVDGQSRWTRR
jgi:hypothetical protein